VIHSLAIDMLLSHSEYIAAQAMQEIIRMPMEQNSTHTREGLDGT
jgi:hypothetical protein